MVDSLMSQKRNPLRGSFLSKQSGYQRPDIMFADQLPDHISKYRYLSRRKPGLVFAFLMDKKRICVFMVSVYDKISVMR